MLFLFKINHNQILLQEKLISMFFFFPFLGLLTAAGSSCSLISLQLKGS